MEDRENVIGMVRDEYVRVKVTGLSSRVGWVEVGAINNRIEGTIQDNDI